jgi:SAM-dependent methyltransferase
MGASGEDTADALCRRLASAGVGSRYDDEIWALVPDESPGPPAAAVDLARGLGAVQDALDLGCGDGRLSAELRAERLTVADVSRVALERARLRLPAAHAVELEPDAPLPFADSAFDLVHCADTI